MDPAEAESLRVELAERVAVDQEARRAVAALFERSPDPGRLPVSGLQAEDRAVLERLGAVDADNTAWLRRVLDRHGWPGRRLLGETGAHDAWLLVQHADDDPALQAWALALLETAVGADDASPADLAYLTDRVRLNAGERQVYGTQLEHRDGAWRPRPLEDPEQVDERRAAVGLTPLAEHLAGF